MIQIDDNAAYVTLSGIELTLVDASDTVDKRHRLLLLLCREEKLVSVLGYAAARPPNPAGPIRLAFLPMYRQTQEHDHPEQSVIMGYMTASSQMGTVRGKLIDPQKADFEVFKLGKITHSFLPGVSQCFPFLASEWPSCTDDLRSALSEAIETFIDLINSGAFYIIR